MVDLKNKTVVKIDGNEIPVSNPEKILWPEDRITKITYMEKLTLLSPYLLRYCANRHLTTIRWPHGIQGKSFYQKNCPEPIPDYVHTAPLDGINYVNLDSVSTLMWLANLACLEFHPSFHYIGDTLPAEWVIDIDPSIDPEPRIMEAASIIGELLDSMRIRSIPKTSGATGVQIFIPIVRGYTFDQLRSIGHFIGQYVTAKHPKLFTIERLKKNRGNLIYVDYLQHYYGKTLSAPYTPRARRRGTVSTPLHWEEVRMGARAEDFHLLNIAERLRTTGDLIAGVPPQSLEHVLSFIGKR